MSRTNFLATMAAAAMLFPAAVSAQDRDRDHGDWHDHYDRAIRVDQGMTIPIRLTQTIDVQRSDQTTYPGVVDQDVMGDEGRVAIPAGSRAELHVRTADDGDLVLRLEAITVRDDRYGVSTDPRRIQATQNNDLVGSIIGAIRGNGQVNGQTVRVPRDTVLNFRLERPLEIMHHRDWQ